MYRVAIVEDNEQSSNKLKKYIDRYAEKHDLQFDITWFRDGDEITSDYEADYDIIFMDIDMRRMDGMSAARKIREFDGDVIIIFITNLPQYAIKGYEVEALSFLLKPLPYFAFSQELKKSIDKIDERETDYVLVSTDNGVIRIDAKDIYYLEVMKHNVTVHTKQGSHTMKSTLKKMEEELKNSHFFRCNNCYLVNLDEVKGVKGDFAIVNDERLKISRPRKKGFMEALTAHFGGKL